MKICPKNCRFYYKAFGLEYCSPQSSQTEEKKILKFNSNNQKCCEENEIYGK